MSTDSGETGNVSHEPRMFVVVLFGGPSQDHAVTDIIAPFWSEEAATVFIDALPSEVNAELRPAIDRTDFAAANGNDE